MALSCPSCDVTWHGCDLALVLLSSQESLPPLVQPLSKRPEEGRWGDAVWPRGSLRGCRSHHIHGQQANRTKAVASCKVRPPGLKPSSVTFLSLAWHLSSESHQHLTQQLCFEKEIRHGSRRVTYPHADFSVSPAAFYFTGS